MKKTSILIAIAALLTLCFTAAAQTDLRIKKSVRLNMPGMPGPMKNPQTGETMDPSKLPDTNILIKGPRMVTESRMEASTGMGTKKYINTTIRQCDLKRDVTFTNKSKNYYVTKLGTSVANSQRPGVKNVSTAGERKGGSVTYSLTYTDTGERQQMFGRTARHIKSTIATTPSADACDKTKMKIETDAWYIDLPTFSCPTFSVPNRPAKGGASGGCNDEKIFQVNGKADNGFAVRETQTISDGSMSFSLISEVTEMSMSSLDPALFDVPPGYTEGKASQVENANDVAENDETPSAMPPSGPGPQSTIVASMPPPGDGSIQAKKAGVIRIGIAKPTVKTPDSKDDYSAPLQLSAAIRDTFVEGLKAENVEAIRLSTDAPESEARQLGCDYILYSNVVQKRGGGGMFGKMIAMGALSAVGGFIPGVGGMVASTIASVAMSQTMGKTAKAKDEFALDYKVTNASNAVVNQGTSKAKTKADGEDVLTPQLKQAATTVLGVVTKRP